MVESESDLVRFDVGGGVGLREEERVSRVRAAGIYTFRPMGHTHCAECAHGRQPIASADRVEVCAARDDRPLWIVDLWSYFVMVA